MTENAGERQTTSHTPEPCCNAKHLLGGTKADNNRDARERGRAVPPTQRRGSANTYAKLTESDVEAIRMLRGIPLMQVAASFNVSKATISLIQNRKRWSHV